MRHDRSLLRTGFSYLAFTSYFTLLIALPLMAQDVSTLVNTINASGGVSVGPDGNVYVADFGARLNNANGTTVYRVTPQGDVSVFATGFQGASGNVFDASGNLIQSNIQANRLDSIDSNGNVTTLVSSGLSSPVGVAIASDGTIFVANCAGSTISRINNGAGVTFASGAPLNCPNGLTIDDDDILYTANFNNGNIVRIDQSGQMTVLATTPNSSFRTSGGNGHITYGNGRLYVVGNASAQIFELTLDGQLTLIAGDGTRGHKNGPALQSSFSSPNGIALSADGRFLYVNEAQSTQGAVLNANSFPLNPSLLRVIELDGGQNINAGMTGTWFDAATPGQGLLFDVIISQQSLFAAWFTYETDQEITLAEGDNELRWLIGQGPIVDNSVSLQLFSTDGGLFDDPAMVTETLVGTATITFSSCLEAIFEYSLDAGLQGTAALSRLTPDVFCTGLASEGN